MLLWPLFSCLCSGRAGAEKGTAVLAFPIMDFLVKGQRINKLIYVRGGALCVRLEVKTRDRSGGGES